MKKSVTLGTVATGALIAALAQPALAQAPQTGAVSGIQDIVVTARRTEESLQTTPIAVTALNPEALTTAKVETVVDLQRTAPGLVIGRGSAGGDGIVFVAIRGQGNLQPILANDPAVATYIDGIYIPRPSTGMTDLQDIQRLEVLRGPQGTLFGRNTTGGAINIITSDPDDQLSGMFKAEYGNYNNLGVSASVNVPLAQDLAIRVSGAINDREGYGTNPLNNRDFSDNKSKFLRGKLKYDGNGWDVTLSADWNRQTNQGQQTALWTFNPAIVPAPFQPGLTAGLLKKANWWDNTATGTSIAAGIGALTPEAQALYGVQPFNTLEVYGFSGTINVELGGLNLKSITGYRHSMNYGLSDTDGTAVPLLGTFAGSGSYYVSQELQISGNITDSLSFITGAYAGKESGYEFSRSQIFGGLIRDSNADVTNKTFGLFAQAYYELTPTLRAVGGFRYTWDTRDSVLHNAQVLGRPYDVPVAGTPTGINCTVTPSEPVTATTCNQVQNAKFNYPAWNLGIDWQAADNIFLYAATRGAAKAGGWNLRAGGLPAFAPEKVKDVEAGLKIDLFDRRVRFNTAIFHTWKDDNQAIVNSFVPGIGVTQYIQNNGKVRIWGIENELTVVPWEGMTLSVNGSLQDGKYVKGTFSETQVIAGSGCTNPEGVVNGCVVDLSGLPLLQTPKKQLNISATQKIPLGGGTLAVTGAYAYIGAQHFDAVKAADQASAATKAAYDVENRLGRVPGYGIFNGRIAFQLENPNVEIAVYGRNIGDKKYLLRRFPDLYRTLGIAAAYVGQPGTYGVETTFRF
ncbi:MULTISPECIES: TonB-dependent receptor [Sphingobium]|uniref:TonB-denpendent receptor n=2 Tax=Sphingobium cupriresistens TaxID=1132417 RepID=A0A0J8ADC8_9SPHN|nr:MULTISPECIES: TonB-dependent receptor [Sphingobium]KMS53075.1 TonB-denpendent receptor [Sphingobium cupriresistens LL01]RYM12027.1 TonB-dependent receptor [Sphingobium cupriresistens]WCP15342.1 Vitamin B12 transporter BtuB [Sphingobium sp. AntQ-1]